MRGTRSKINDAELVHHLSGAMESRADQVNAKEEVRTVPSRPNIQCKQLHPVLQVEDVSASVEFYCDILGFEVGFMFDPPTIAGVNLGDVSIHLELGTPSPAGSSIYFVVTDVDALYGFYNSNSVEILFDLEDQEYGLRDFSIKDNSGYVLSFGQHISHSPKLKIERASLDVKLEKRLLAVVEEIAVSKDMDVSQMLEETLLHTFERLPDGGVASPHSEATLELIQNLKTKHGINYETHDCYRFEEDIDT